MTPPRLRALIHRTLANAAERCLDFDCFTTAEIARAVRGSCPELEPVAVQDLIPHIEAWLRERAEEMAG